MCWTTVYMEDRAVCILDPVHIGTHRGCALCIAQCWAMFLCYLEDNLVGKCTCTHMMGLNTTTAHGLCSVHIRSIHIGVHIRSSAHLHTWRGAHISSHSMSPTSAMRSRHGSSATRVERHLVPRYNFYIWAHQNILGAIIHFFVFGSPHCNCVLACLCNHRVENIHTTHMIELFVVFQCIPAYWIFKDYSLNALTMFVFCCGCKHNHVCD